MTQMRFISTGKNGFHLSGIQKESKKLIKIFDITKYTSLLYFTKIVSYYVLSVFVQLLLLICFQ